jgi:hypothetical protein
MRWAMIPAGCIIWISWEQIDGRTNYRHAAIGQGLPGEVHREMKPWLLVGLLVLGGILFVQTVRAADLTNEDAVPYAVQIQDSAGQREVIIVPGETLLDICQRCHIAVGDNGAVSAEPTNTIIIRNGKLSVSS